ncbi:MAG: hypothetical protein U0840_09380 [Gemmataceae bacterium]
MSATLTHGTRKSLADQLDRFDTMLDGLAEAIPEAVADAVRVAVAEAVREAVQHAITEVLTHPEVLARIREATTPQPAPAVVAPNPCPSSSTSRSLSRLRLWCAVARIRCAQACTAMANWLRSARDWTAEHIQVTYHWRKPILVGLGAGFAVALASPLLGPLAGSLLCAASVFTLVVVAFVLASRPVSPSSH